MGPRARDRSCGNHKGRLLVRGQGLVHRPQPRECLVVIDDRQVGRGGRRSPLLQRLRHPSGVHVGVHASVDPDAFGAPPAREGLESKERKKVPASKYSIVSMMSRQPENVGEILQGLDRRKQQTTLERALILSFIFFPPSALQTVTFLVARRRCLSGEFGFFDEQWRV